jgi:hypothetical protein
MAPTPFSYLHGRLHSVLLLDFADGRMCNVYIVSNPDELARLPVLPSLLAEDATARAPIAFDSNVNRDCYLECATIEVRSAASLKPGRGRLPERLPIAEIPTD